jgi:hypothetical protein
MPSNDALAEWLRRVPAKYMGFPRESSNLSGVVIFSFLFISIVPHFFFPFFYLLLASSFFNETSDRFSLFPFYCNSYTFFFLK